MRFILKETPCVASRAIRSLRSLYWLRCAPLFSRFARDGRRPAGRPGRWASPRGDPWGIRTPDLHLESVETSRAHVMSTRHKTAILCKEGSDRYHMLCPAPGRPQPVDFQNCWEKCWAGLRFDLKFSTLERSRADASRVHVHVRSAIPRSSSSCATRSRNRP